MRPGSWGGGGERGGGGPGGVVGGIDGPHEARGCVIN